MKKIIFIVWKILIPLMLLIVLPLSPIFLFDSKMTNIGLQILLKNEREYNLAIEMLKYLNINITYLFSILILIILLNFFKKQNKDRIFNSNSNIYYNFYYALFWIASNILGYDKIQLAGIPIQMQYKIVLRSTFNSIVPDMWMEHYDEVPDGVEVTLDSIIVNDPKKINFIISDTYFLKDEEIDAEYNTNSVIRITSNLSDRRYVNKELVQKTREAIQLVREKGYKEIFIFSTANPQNNLNIINSSFRFFGRFVDFKVFVIQKNEEKCFFKKYNREKKLKYEKKYRII
ncbi:hypothetical protein KQI76_01545 [Amphibacillus sp. MSJ-3]|uniref:hypothetical protein n=1 Tax=Amphibacillus sp. MSJ-3 TaxID=2841505 RepID=UPI001C0EBA1F|nr:hypothetical protein [Amphibacillus sp. MSJ-3]MBU5593840.1 hypothetical protein [Amphibacillus sp. MSJ-3]